MATIDAYVLGGLPVTVEFSICRAEPDVGLMSDYSEDHHIIEINGIAKDCSWIEKKMSGGDWEKLIAECDEAAYYD